MAYNNAVPADDLYVKDVPKAIRDKGEDVVMFARVPPGMVMHFAGADAPSGWLVCDGREISRSTYAELFSAIGTLYGAGNTTTTFNLPDLRDEFIRGKGDENDVGDKQADQIKSHTHAGGSASAGAHTHTGSVNVNSAGAHSHSVSGTAASSTHSHSGSAVGSLVQRHSSLEEGQGGLDRPLVSHGGGDHTHSVSGTAASAGAHTHTGSATIDSAGAHSHPITISNTGGSETRPRNIALLPCIKV